MGRSGLIGASFARLPLCRQQRAQPCHLRPSAQMPSLRICKTHFGRFARSRRVRRKPCRGSDGHPVPQDSALPRRSANPQRRRRSLPRRPENRGSAGLQVRGALFESRRPRSRFQGARTSANGRPRGTRLRGGCGRGRRRSRHIAGRRLTTRSAARRGARRHVSWSVRACFKEVVALLGEGRRLAVAGAGRANEQVVAARCPRRSWRAKCPHQRRGR